MDAGWSGLNGAVTSGDTIITVNDGAKFGTKTGALLTIWDSDTYAYPENDPNMEVVQVTAIATHDLTVTRAQLSTQAAEHSSGDPVGMYDHAQFWTEHENVIDSNTNRILPTVAKTTTYTLTSTDVVVLCTGTFTVTLPTAVGIAGKAYFVKNVSTGVITLDGAGSETIDGAATQAIRQWDTLQASSDGANWVIL